jgi:hypothetical protein
MSPERPIRAQLLGMLASAAAIVAALVAVAPGRAAADPCWRRVIDEWSAGRLGGNHPTSCYRQAIAHAPADLRLYSTFDDDVRRAMQTGVLDHAGGGRVRRVSDVPPTRATGSAEWRPGDVTLAASAVVLVTATWTATALAVRRRRGSAASSGR